MSNNIQDATHGELADAGYTAARWAFAGGKPNLGILLGELASRMEWLEMCDDEEWDD